MKKKVGIIGYGWVAGANHKNSYAQAKNVEIVAVCDTNKAALERAKRDYNLPDEALFDDYKKLIDSGLCDMVDIVPGIEKIEGDPNYLFEVKFDVYLDGSELYGNFFHYVKFDGFVSMNNVTVRSNFSCFKSLFMDSVYMQHIHVTGNYNFEQCEFRKGLVLTGAKVHIFNFSHSTIHERLSLSSVSLENQNYEGYNQYIGITNSVVEDLNLSKVNTMGLPICIEKSKINGFRIDCVSLDSVLSFNSCILEGVMTALTDGERHRSQIKEIYLHGCELNGQYHIENMDIEKFQFNFSQIGDNGRLRLSQCGVKVFTIGCSSVFGQMDILENKITGMCMEGTCVQGYLNYKGDKIDKYADRYTVRLLKNEALKVNDHVAATRLYAKEMNMLLEDNSISFWDKVSLWLSKWFSGYGENWVQSVLVTLVLCVMLTLLMLGLGSKEYGFNPSGEFIGVESFITALLDSINVFSIPLFRDTINEYGLNTLGQILYFIIKLIVTYGAYQFVISFRKYGRG